MLVLPGGFDLNTMFRLLNPLFDLLITYHTSITRIDKSTFLNDLSVDVTKTDNAFSCL